MTVSAGSDRYPGGGRYPVIPRLEKLKKEGQAGQAKITQYTRYLTVGLAVPVSATYVELARSGNLFPGTGCSAASHPLIPHPTAFTLVMMMVTMVSGTSVIMWMGELITDCGIGNGMSVLIFTSTLSVIFDQIEQIYLTKGRDYALLAVLVVLVVIAFVVFIERAQRRIVLGMAEGTVKSSASRGLEQLRMPARSRIS